MVIVELDGKEYPVKNKVSELTIGQFEKLNSYFENISDIIDRWISIISDVSDLTEEQLLSVDVKKFELLVKSMFVSKWERVQLKEVELDGKIYRAKQNRTARDMSLLEKILANEKEHKVSMIIASFFVTEDEGKKQYDLKHIKKKAKLFRELPCEGYIDYLYGSVERFIDFIAKSSAPIKGVEEDIEK